MPVLRDLIFRKFPVAILIMRRNHFVEGREFYSFTLLTTGSPPVEIQSIVRYHRSRFHLIREPADAPEQGSGTKVVARHLVRAGDDYFRRTGLGSIDDRSREAVNHFRPFYFPDRFTRVLMDSQQE